MGASVIKPEALQKSQSQTEAANAGHRKGGPSEVTAATPEAIGESGQDGHGQSAAHDGCTWMQADDNGLKKYKI